MQTIDIILYDTGSKYGLRERHFGIYSAAGTCSLSICAYGRRFLQCFVCSENHT